jgi:hypothetical protein
MPKYHFIIAQDDVIHRDGFELPDMNAAWHEATKTCGEMIRDLDGSLKPDSRWALTIQDKTGKPLRTIEVIIKNGE